MSEPDAMGGTGVGMDNVGSPLPGSETGGKEMGVVIGIPGTSGENVVTSTDART